MKVVLTGASGFMARAFLERLLAANETPELVLLAGSRSSVELLQAAYPGLAVEGPWPSGGHALREALRDADVLFHFAWSTMPSTAAADPLRDLRENVVAGMELLDQVKEAGVRRMVFISSGGTVYGEPRYLPIDEEHPLAPQSPYGISKLTFEHYLRQHAERHGYGHLVLRPANVYGNTRVDGRPQGVLEHWMRRMVDGRSLEVWNDLGMVRDYVYIDDMVEVLWRVLQQDALSGVLNVGTGVGTSLQQLIDMLERMTGRQARVERAAVPVKAVTANVLSPQLLIEQVGALPFLGLHEGMERLQERFLAGG